MSTRFFTNRRDNTLLAKFAGVFAHNPEIRLFDALVHDNEEEVRGYQAALSWIHERHSDIPLSTDTVLRLHALSRPNTGDGGVFKEKDGEIVETHWDVRAAAAKLPEASDRSDPSDPSDLSDLPDEATLEDQP